MATKIKIIEDARPGDTLFFVVEYNENYPQDTVVVGERAGHKTRDEAQAEMEAYIERWGAV